MKLPHYIEIETKRNGRLFTRTVRRGFLFDMYAWFMLWQAYGWDFDKIRQLPQDEISNEMLYFGALSYCKESGQKVDFTREDVQRWNDNLTRKEIVEFAKVITESIPKFQEDKSGGGSKKK